jgi:hypothetical protein
MGDAGFQRRAGLPTGLIWVVAQVERQLWREARNEVRVPFCYAMFSVDKVMSLAHATAQASAQDTCRSWEGRAATGPREFTACPGNCVCWEAVR